MSHSTLASKTFKSSSSVAGASNFLREFFMATPAYLFWSAMQELLAERRAQPKPVRVR